MIACLRWEWAKFVRRRRNLILIALPNLLPALAVLLLLLALPFDLGWRQKLVIPAVTGLVGMGLSFAQYFQPAVLAILAAAILAGEDGSGALRTAFLTFRPRWQVILSRLLLLVAASFLSVALSLVLFALAMFLAWVELDGMWWKAFDYPCAEVLRACLRWLPWFMASQIAMVGFLGAVNVFCRSTHGAVALSLVLLAAMGVASVVGPDLATRLGLELRPERWIFTWHYSAPMDPDVIQRLVFGGSAAAPDEDVRLRRLLAQGALFWIFGLWAYGRRDITT